MNKFTLTICCVILLFTGSNKQTTSVDAEEWTFQTTPDKWRQSRIFHTPFDDTRANRIKIERALTIETESEKTFSSNGAYWFSVIKPDFIESATRNVHINIYNECDYFVRLHLLDINHYPIHTKWINEKILYIRAWWGRVLGVDLLFDAESEQIIYKENVNDGGLAYLQWQKAKTEE